MPEQEVRLKSPDKKRCLELAEKLDSMIEAGVFEVACTPDTINESEAVDLTDMLKWVHQFLAQRSDYHKKRQTEQKVLRETLKSELTRRGADVEAILRKARNTIADTIIDESDEEPVLPLSLRRERGEA